MENLSAVLYGAKDIRMENLPIPSPKPEEVLLEMACVGICGSDVHFYKDGRIGEYVVMDPMVCGHEASGVVVQTGKAVTTFKKGDRVAVEPGVPCRRCRFCSLGRYNLCNDMAFCACPPVHGTLCRYFSHPADLCYKLPDHVSLEEGALLEPLAVAVHACRKAEIKVGSTVFLAGAGTIGMVCMFVARAMGAIAILVTDVREDRINTAKELGAQHTLLVTHAPDVRDTCKQIRQMLGSDPDVSIDCCGTESAMCLALHVTKKGGIVVQVGLPMDDVKVPLIQSLFKEIQIRGSFRYANAYPEALALVSAHKIPLESLITAEFYLEDTVDAFEAAGVENCLKVMIRCQKEPKETRSEIEQQANEFMQTGEKIKKSKRAF